MAYRRYVQIYGSTIIPQERAIEIVKDLPVPSKFTVLPNIIDQEVKKRFAKAEPKFIDLYNTPENPSKEQIVEFFSHKDAYDSLHYAWFWYELSQPSAKFSEEGIGIKLIPNFGQRLGKEAAKTPFELEIRNKGMLDLVTRASILYLGGEDGKRDKSFFDYAGIIVPLLITNGEEKNYKLSWNELSGNGDKLDHNFVIMEGHEFLGQLERLVQENCRR